MRAGWTEAALGELVQPVESVDPIRRYPDGSFTYIDLSAINRESKRIETSSRLRGEAAPSRARQLLRSGDVLVSTVRPNLNSVAVVGPSLDGAIGSTGFTVLRTNGKLHTAYLFHWVRTRPFIDALVRQATGASYPAVSDRIVKSTRIPLPSLDEQQRIAEVLNRADALRAKRRAAFAQVAALTQSLFIDMFGDDPLDRSFCWPTITLSEAVMDGTVVTYGIVQAGEEVPDGVPYIRTSDIVGGEIAIHQLRRTAPRIAARFSRSRVQGGDIVMSIRATVGTTAVVPPELDGSNLTQGTARIAPSDAVQGPYLLNMLRTPGVQHWIQRQVKGATFREITLSRLRELPVRVPPQTLQRDFACRSAQVDGLKRNQRASLARFDCLFASLRHRAFAGEL